MNQRQTAIAVALGAAVGLALGLGGFFMTHFEPTRGMGLTMFLVTPFAAGFAATMIVKDSSRAAAAALLALLGSLAILIATGKEGMLCAILAFPVLLAFVAAGCLLASLLRWFLRRHHQNETTFTAAIVLLAPAILFASHHFERPILERVRSQTVVNEVHVPPAPEIAWKSIQNIDEVSASKPFLMYIGLPIPQRCTLDRPGLGARRICYFDHGSIEEIVTEWAPPYRMRLRIDRTNMPGRHWLGFEDAVYDLSADAYGTTVKRTTVITSHLYPAWYWSPFERMGVDAEHRYILADLARRLAR